MSQSKALPAIFQGLDAGLRMFRWVVLVLLAFFFASGITMVQPNNIALVLRFGRLEGKTAATQINPPGLLLALPYPIDQVIQVPVREEGEVTTEEVWKSLKTEDEKERSYMIDPIKEGYVLTGDRNIVQAKVTVKYQISDPIAFRLWVEDPEAIITDTVLAALTQTVCSWKVDDVIRQQRVGPDGSKPSGKAAKEGTAKRNAPAAPLALAAPPALAAPLAPAAPADADATPGDSGGERKGSEGLARQVWKKTQRRLDEVKIGVTITALEFDAIHPPRHVISWFHEVESRKISKQTAKSEAESFKNETVKGAETQAAQRTAQAKTYYAVLTSQAQAELSAFQPLHAKYVENPELVAQRLYAETLEEVFRKVGKLDFLNKDTRVIFSGSEKQQ